MFSQPTNADLRRFPRLHWRNFFIYDFIQNTSEPFLMAQKFHFLFFLLQGKFSNQAIENIKQENFFHFLRVFSYQECVIATFSQTMDVGSTIRLCVETKNKMPRKISTLFYSIVCPATRETMFWKPFHWKYMNPCSVYVLTVIFLTCKIKICPKASEMNNKQSQRRQHRKRN